DERDETPGGVAFVVGDDGDVVDNQRVEGAGDLAEVGGAEGLLTELRKPESGDALLGLGDNDLASLHCQACRASMVGAGQPSPDGVEALSGGKPGERDIDRRVAEFF